MNIPLSCYIHLPWCIKKCPYCDFNSHSLKNNSFPEQQYLNCLIQEIQYWAQQEKRPIHSVFIGGGTPSLFSDQSIATLLDSLVQHFTLAAAAEITIEVNPGAAERKFLAGYRTAGVNRISLGVQSFQNKHLSQLGRIHNQAEIFQAVEAIASYFDNYNLDLMYGLPGQTLDDLIQDLNYAVQCSAPHLSWYNLTIEPNTWFAKYPPQHLPTTDRCYEMQDLIINFLVTNNYNRYEVAAYAQPGRHSQHNSNYWQFGDYIGIGAGAASKITSFGGAAGKIVTGITRTMNIKQPEAYMRSKFSAGQQQLTHDNIAGLALAGEFLMNSLRLTQGFEISIFEQRTGLKYDVITEKIEKYIRLGLLQQQQQQVLPTPRGIDLLNEILMDFI